MVESWTARREESLDGAERSIMTCGRWHGLLVWAPCGEIDITIAWRLGTWRCVSCGSYLDLVVFRQRQRNLAAEEAARSEIYGEFRAGLSNLLDSETVERQVDREVQERLPVAGTSYVTAVDSASGSGKDRFTLSIAHVHGDTVVQDVSRAWAPPFNPSGVISEIAALVKQYQVHEVWGDKYAPGFVAEQFRSHILEYRYLEQDRSALYLELVSLVNAGKALFVKVPELLRELVGLVRRRGPSGRDRVDHPAGRPDDLANSAAASLVVAARRLKAWVCAWCGGDCAVFCTKGSDPATEDRLVPFGPSGQMVDRDLAAQLSQGRVAGGGWH
jgi:hypothetical protein